MIFEQHEPLRPLPKGGRSHLSPRAIFFDLDQTLIQHTRPMVALAREALLRLAPEHAAIVSEFEAVASGGGAVWQRIDALTGRGEQALTEMLANALADCGCSPLLASRLLQDLAQAIIDSSEPTVNAHAAIDGLVAMGVSVGIITNGFKFLQTRKASTHRLLDRVHAIITSEDAGAHKPDPRIFDFALKQLGVGAAEAWYVGDNYEKDVCGAARAGLATILFDPERRYERQQLEETLDKPSYVIGDLCEVTRLIASGRGGRKSRVAPAWREHT